MLLHHEAAQVFAVDVGYGILDFRLRSDPRVVVCERTNARIMTPADLGLDSQPVGLKEGEKEEGQGTSGGAPVHHFDVLVCDASFIPLHLGLALPPSLCAPTAPLATRYPPWGYSTLQALMKCVPLRSLRKTCVMLRRHQCSHGPWTCVGRGQ